MKREIPNPAGNKGKPFTLALHSFEDALRKQFSDINRAVLSDSLSSPQRGAHVPDRNDSARNGSYHDYYYRGNSTVNNDRASTEPNRKGHI